jgi:hypothetical protein
MIYALVTCAPYLASSPSFSLNRSTYTPKLISTRLPKASLYPFQFPLRFAAHAHVNLSAVSNCWFRAFRKRSLYWGQRRNVVYRGYV